MKRIAHKLDVDFTVDTKGLYREESFFDLKVASIRQLTPVNPDGSLDDSRSPVFVGYTKLMSPRGPLTVHCKIEALSLQEAIERFPEAMTQALEKMIEEADKEDLTAEPIC
ncbi:MAG: hypothetical protein JRJ03_08895 [Deltaproteobacteria bacterium]|nr:hypothetical protein [Deltaproteobacteria bacterium]